MLKTLKSVIKSIIPEATRVRLRRISSRIRHFGFARYCPTCGSHVRHFGNYGVLQRPNAECQVCGSLERHRLMSIYFPARTNLFDGTPKKMLHVAPERHFVHLFSNIKGLDYLSADLDRPLAMVKMDITKIQYPGDSFDVIYCSHVLEHIPNDRLAMSELFRVLKPGGWAILQVPQADLDTTYEDFSITDPAEREKHFGQCDHVRWYGRDYKDRLEQAGFKVTVDHFAKELDPSIATRYGLMLSESVYMCRK